MTEVEHPCPRCGTSVKDDSAFCSNCGAAQVHYSARPDAADSITLSSGQAVLSPTLIHAAPAYGTGSVPADTKATIRAAFYAGLVAALLSSLPIGAGFILAFPLAGFLSVRFYRRWTRPGPRTSAALRLGALTGLFGFVGLTVLMAVQTLIFHAQNDIRDALVEAVRQQQARAADAQARQMLDYFMSPQGMALMIIAGFIFMGIVLILLTAAGAALSASFARRKGPPEQ